MEGSKGPPVSFLKITFELIGLLAENIETFPEFIWAREGNKSFQTYCFIARGMAGSKTKFKEMLIFFYLCCDVPNGISDDVII